MKKILMSVLLGLAVSIGVYASPVFDDSVQSESSYATTKQELLFKKSSNATASVANLLSEQQGSMMKVNMSCGIPPIPPIGCRVGACMCDQNGNNCQWTFICR